MHCDILLQLHYQKIKIRNFTWKEFQAKTNNELAAILGNFVNRTLTFVHNNMGGRVPILSNQFSALSGTLRDFSLFYLKHRDQSFDELRPLYTTKFGESLSENEYHLFLSLALGTYKIYELYKKFKIKDAVMETMNLARAANKYFNDEEPWKTIKTNPDYCHKTIFVCCQVVYTLSIVFAPIIPYTSAKIQGFFQFKSYIRNS